ncbi:MAG: hypothetical protein KTR24_07075 [Saprospiraceae bacterium]|nr:hypothetical protein [Saprospiraceae bacterium]
MKRILLSALVCMLSFAVVQAQDCSAAKKASCDMLTKQKCNYSSAAMAASLDDQILTVFDTKDMKTKYLRKRVCAGSGSVSFDEVKFDHGAARFVSAKEYECNWKKCLKNPNCCIKPMSSQSSDRGAVAVALESEKKRT